jgi:hypothetical protein
MKSQGPDRLAIVDDYDGMVQFCVAVARHPDR